MGQIAGGILRCDLIDLTESALGCLLYTSSGALAGFCIPKIAKDQEAALSVIDYYLSYEAQAIGWNTMYASPVVDTAKLENLDHADWLEETNMDELRYFSIGMIQKDIVVRWAEEIAPLAQ